MAIVRNRGLLNRQPYIAQRKFRAAQTFAAHQQHRRGHPHPPVWRIDLLDRQSRRRNLRRSHTRKKLRKHCKRDNASDNLRRHFSSSDLLKKGGPAAAPPEVSSNLSLAERELAPHMEFQAVSGPSLFRT